MNNEEDKNYKKKYYYNRNNFINKGLHLKNRSPILSHQENNFYYNTRINHLIFQEYSNNNVDKNMCEQSNIPYNNSMCIKYDLLDSNLNEGKNIIDRNLESSSYKNSISLKKPEKFKNMKLDLNETEINMNSKNINELGTNISTTRSKNRDNSYLKNINSGNNTATYNNMRNRHNLFHSNKIKKKNNTNNNEIEKETNDNNESQNSKNYPIKSLKNILSKNSIENNNAFIDLMSYKNINNNYFYNIQNNYEKNDNKEIKKNILGKNNIFLNNFTSINSSKKNEINCKKIPLKNDKVGNYQIKSPGSSKTQKISFNKFENKINKSPEISGNKKIKNDFDKNSKNKFSNVIKNNKKFSNNNNKENNIENNNKKKIINVNTNNKKNKLNNNENGNTKRNLINNINIYNSFPKKNTTNNINEKNISKYKLNNNETNAKINHKNTKNKMYYYYNQIKEIPKKTNFKKYNSLMNNKLKKFCDILEQLFYISFKNNFKNFIKKMIEYIDYNNSKRALIIRRFESVKKINNNNLKNNNNLNLNNSFSNTNNYNNYRRIKMNSLINEKIFQNKLKKSPSKFLELQDNIQSSMMQINQDNYIQMFNELFMKERENSLNKKCRSPLVERNIKDSFNINDNDENSAYDKYKTNTNNELFYFPKKNNYKSSNIKINLEENYINNINSNKNAFIGNIFDDDNINDQLKYNFSIDDNLKRDYSNVKLIDESDRKYFNKKMLLYSKPILKKTTNNIPNNNLNMINFENSGRNNCTNSMRNVISSSSKNFSSYKKHSDNQSKIIELNNIKKIGENKKEYKKNEIIVKNVHTKDKRLNVFIKYIKIQNYKAKKCYKEKLVNIHTESISIFSKYSEKVKIYNLRNNNLNDININNSNRDIEDTNQQETIINNSYEDENTKIIFLINFLQNILNDNKKTILYNFFKNLKKIKTNCILQNSINSKGKYKSNKFKEKKIDRKKIIELPKYSNNNFTKIKPSINIARNKEEDEEKYLEVNIIKSGQDLSKKINHNKNEISSILYNKSFNNLFDKNSKKFEEKINVNDKDNSIDETIKKEQLKKIKLAKLGKLFKNLEQENNLINTIKEQFLDWTNKQNIHLKKDKNKENIIKQDDLDKKIYEFRNKLICFIFKHKKGKIKHKYNMK